VLSSWSRTIVDALDAALARTDIVLAEAGFSRDSLRDPNARLPLAASARLWEAAARETGDPAFGLRASRFVRPTTFHALGYAVFASATLRDALNRLVRYSHLVSDAGEVVLENRPGTVRLSFVPLPAVGPYPVESIDAVMSLVVRTCRSLTDGTFTLRLVELQRPEPADAVPYQRCFRCPIEFSARDAALTCDDATLDRPLPTANPALALHNDELVRRYLTEMRTGSVADRVRAVLSQSVAQGAGGDIGPAAVAACLGMSLRSLQRRLGEQGVSYVSLLSDTRKELACAYLLEERYSVTEVAFRLGFDDASAFARAFRRWTGLSPTEYRARASGPAR
jgi:AraC-like DNA-binding protein